MKVISAILEKPESRGYTMREAIDSGTYYHVRVPGWASGGWDVGAVSSPEYAALAVGGFFKFYGWNGLPDVTGVSRHLKGSTIGATYMEDLGQFPTSNEFMYDI